MAMTDEQKRMFADGTSRRGTIEKLHRAGRTDAETLSKELKGIRVRKNNVTYEISEVSYNYNGDFNARGYRIVKGGKRGTQRWDVGRLYPACFEGVE